MDEQIEQTPFNHPYIAVVQMDFAINMFLVIEREVVCDVSSVFRAVKVLLASYLVFNISYPNLLGGLFVFLMFYVCIKLSLRKRCLSRFHSYVVL